MKNLEVLKDSTGPIGVAGLLVGLAVGLTLGWTTVPFVLLGLGLALVAVWIATHWSILANVLGLRSTQTNLNILVSVIALVVILGVVNVFATRFDKTFDLTQEGLYSLSPQTVDVVKNLKSPLKIWVVTEDKGDAPTRETLSRYERLNSEKFSFEFLNPRTQFAKLKDLNGTRSNVFILQAGERTQEIDKPAPQQIESTLTPAILSIIGAQSVTAYLTEGHGELSANPTQPGAPGLAQAKRALESEGYTLTNLKLLETETIPDNANLIIVAGPQTAFLKGEVDKLSNYLAAGGKLMLMLPPQVEHGLDDLLKAWQVEARNDIVVDQIGQRLVGDAVIAIGLNYGSHPITEALASRQVFTLFPLARSLTTTSATGFTLTNLVNTNPQAWGERNLDLNGSGDVSFDAEADNPGPVTLAVAVSKPLETEETPENPPGEEPPAPPEARLVVFGNAGFASDTFFNQQGNRDLFLNAVNWLAEQSDRISIRPKSPTNRRFKFENTGVSYVFLIAVFGLPGLALATGFALWWQRR